MEGFSYNDLVSDFTKEEILYTYRKVKRELYNEKEHIYIEDIVKFEENIFDNIEFLLDILKNGSENLLIEFVNNNENIGKPNFIFKSIKFEENIEGKEKFKVKKTTENFKRELFKIDKEDGVDFRFIGNVSIFFQLIGGLWINRIGYKLDKLFPENVYGCRLKKFDEEVHLPYFKQNHSLYKPYFNDYRKWQNDLFDKIEFLENKDVVVITSDLKKYYHSIEVSILKNKVVKLITENEIIFSKQDELLNDLLFRMINKFNELNNSSYSNFFEPKLDTKKFGLPLTLNVSKILANIYLLEFDKDIIRNVRPIYYGRYVDDLIIAIEYNSDKDNLSFKNVLNTLKEFEIGEVGELKNKGTNELNLTFNLDKENIFLFNNKKDKVELNHIRKSINKSSSEWKLLPDTSDYDEKNDLDLFLTINKECDEVNSLRKSSGLILKRNKFIKEILSFESDIKNFDNKLRSNRLYNFLHITFDFIFDIKNFIDLSKYVPRLFGLLIHSSNDEIIKKYFDELSKVVSLIQYNIEKYDQKNLSKFYITVNFMNDKIYENLICSNPLNKNNSGYALNLLSNNQEKSDAFLNNVIRFFNTDLHSIPFKNCYFKYQEYVNYIVSSLDVKEVDILTELFFNQNIKEFIENKMHSSKCNCEDDDCNKFCYKIFEGSGFHFFTRRISLLELSVAFKNDVISDYDNFVALAKRYYHKFEINPTIEENVDYKCVDFINTKVKINPKVCNTHFLTNESSFDAVVRQIAEPDSLRYDRLTKLVNDLIINSKQIDYVTFHELALPRNYYIQIAQKLGFVKINLISGIEYKVDDSKNTADNQLVYVLNVDNNSGGSIALYQSKIIGAIHENSEIYNRGNLTIQPNYKDKLIIKHNNFIFSGLICNDLLDINNRTYLRGQIDALFVVAWNQDIETYQHLVKSATLDIHCFVSLCNNKKYGDTRIRAPYKDDWRRDMQKIHGGILDNFMVTELEVQELRDFQTNKVPPSKPFKPFPSGFKISDERKKR